MNNKQFIALHAKAYKVFEPIALRILDQEETNQLELAAAGVLPSEYGIFAAVVVGEKMGLKVDFSLKLGFERYDSAGRQRLEYSRTKQIRDTLTGYAQLKAAKRREAGGKAGKAEKAGDPLTVALEAFAALSAAQKKAFLAVVK